MPRFNPAATEVTAQNTFTGSHQANHRGGVAVNATGGVGTVTLQSSLDGGANWADVDSIVVSTSTGGIRYLPTAQESIRAGVKTGDYTSGTITITLKVV